MQGVELDTFASCNVSRGRGVFPFLNGVFPSCVFSSRKGVFPSRKGCKNTICALLFYQVCGVLRILVCNHAPVEITKIRAKQVNDFALRVRPCCR